MPAGKLYKYKPSKYSKTKVDKKQDKQIKKNTVQLKKLSKAEELKYMDGSFQIIPAVTPGPVVTSLLDFKVWDSSLTGGNANLQRISSREGLSCNITKIQIKGLLMITPTNPITGTTSQLFNRFRIIIVHSKDSTVPTAANILQEPGKIDTHYKIKPKFPYTPLYDRTFQLMNLFQGQAASTTNTPTEPWRVPLNIVLSKKKLGKSGTKVEFSDILVATSSPPTRGDISMICMSDCPTIGRAPEFNFECRVRYLDN